MPPKKEQKDLKERKKDPKKEKKDLKKEGGREKKERKKDPRNEEKGKEKKDTNEQIKVAKVTKEEPIVYLHKTDKMNAKLLADKQRKPLLREKPVPPKKDKREKAKDTNEEDENQEEEETSENKKEKEEKENKKLDKSRKRAARELAKERENALKKELQYFTNKHDRMKREANPTTYKDFMNISEPTNSNKKAKLCEATIDTVRQSDTRISSRNNLEYVIFRDMTLHINPTDIGTSTEFVLSLKYSNYNEIESQVKAKEAITEELFNTVLQLYKPQNIVMAFNGGKDSTVTLYMLDRYFQKNHCLKDKKIPAIYIEDPDAFPEVTEFVDDCTKFFHIELIKRPGPIRNAFDEFCLERPHIQAVLMGSRRHDRSSKNLKVMQSTDPDYLKKSLMRINPIVEWKCRDVWQYIYINNVPYCILYQKGYSSLGNKRDTKPNPYLKIIDNHSGRVVDYRPGHEILDNDELERAGRI